MIRSIISLTSPSATRTGDGPSSVSLPESHERLTSPETVASTTSSKEAVVVPSLTEVNPSEVDALLAQELNQLSLQDRERTMEEIHGVYYECCHNSNHAYSSRRSIYATNPTEEEQYLKEGLVQLQKELDMMERNETTESYEMALQRNSPLLQSEEFRIRFLFAEDHDPEKAAVRMVNYFDVANELYGSDALMRPITWNDLSENALQIMMTGCIQVAPFRDAAGRRMAVLVKDVGPGFSYRDRLQVRFYIYQTLSEDPETQRLGMVKILCLHNAYSNLFDPEDNRRISLMLTGMPLKVSAVHICLPENPLLHAARATLLLIIGAKNRKRVRIHVGSPVECNYSLKGFGIPADHLPSTPDDCNKDSLRKHYKWCEVRQAKEALMYGNCLNKNNLQNLAAVECPRQGDCLFGKGQAVTRHPGNVGMRKLVESKVDLYQVAVFKDKARIAWDVVNEFKACGGRFLKEEPNGLYLEVDDETARKKVSIGFRDAVKKARHLLREREEKAKKDRKRVLEHGNIQKNKVDTAATKEDDPFELFSVQNLENDNASLFLSHNHPSKKQRGCCFSAL